MNRAARRRAARAEAKALKQSNKQNTLSFCFEPKRIYAAFEEFVIEDIVKLGNPAFCYNYHHRSRQFNTIDHKSDCFLEINNLKSQGLIITEQKHELKIDGKLWKCLIVIAQNANESLNMNLIDPLGMSIGYYAPGYYYIIFPDTSEFSVL
jgi:hypothetical protein